MKRLTTVFLTICLACTVSSAGSSRLYPPAKDEAGASRVAEVVKVATRAEILGFNDSVKHLLASGLKDSDLKDGSLAIGTVYRCHEATERANLTWFYVPPDVPVALGDIVVVRMGREPTKTDPDAVNPVTEVRRQSRRTPKVPTRAHTIAAAW